MSFTSYVLVLPLFLSNTGGQSRVSRDLVVRHNLNRLVSFLRELLIKLLLLLLRHSMSSCRSILSLLHLYSQLLSNHGLNRFKMLLSIVFSLLQVMLNCFVR